MSAVVIMAHKCCVCDQWRGDRHLEPVSIEDVPGSLYVCASVEADYGYGHGWEAVELSEVTFPNLSDRDSRGRLIERQNRMIGITREDGTTEVVDSFTALETALNL